jgi:hypothetical protein
MLIIVGVWLLVVVLGVGSYLLLEEGPSSYGLAELLGIFSVIFTIVAIIAAIFVSVSCPVDRIASRRQYAAFSANLGTIAEIRANNPSVLRDLMQYSNHAHALQEANTWLAKEKAMNDTMFDAWVPDEIADKPLFTWEDLEK